jgi:hypothetical protein
MVKKLSLVTGLMKIIVHVVAIVIRIPFRRATINHKTTTTTIKNLTKKKRESRLIYLVVQYMYRV